MKEYHAFIEGKRTDFAGVGFEATALPKRLFDFQEAIVKWACKKGRAAIFADTGLGKTAMQTVWADQVRRHTGGMVLIVAPLCVAQQTVKEAAKFGVKVEYVRKQGTAPIQITNYEMLEHFTPRDYAGVVLDESSILKNETGTTRNAIIEACSKVEYRLSCTLRLALMTSWNWEARPSSWASCGILKCWQPTSPMTEAKHPNGC